jgi:bifunctional DNase/RNase
MISRVEVRVSGLAIDERNKTPVVLLQERDGDRVLPIWIGPAEASAIAMELAGKKFQRPLTHDLMKTLVDGLGGEVVRIEVTALQDSTFFARILLRHGEDLIAVDARPSDSIALALRARAPIFVEESLIQSTSGEMSSEDKADALRKYLLGLDLEDFGKFSM